MSGSLVCVGIGMTLGAHITPISRSHIEKADKVYMLMSDGFVENWIESMNDNTESLQQYYQEGKPRTDTYNEMVTALVEAAQSGQKVVAAFYGHPGVFACVAHRAIEQARKLEISASMEAGISAEDCLYADLGIDPGETGCIHYEASQFMFYKRNVDTAAHLILWQVGFAGDISYKKFSTSNKYKKLLVELLKEHYPADHQVILYEARVIAIGEVRKEVVFIKDLSKAVINMQTTLVIPPSTQLTPNNSMRQKIRVLDKQEEQPKLLLIK